MRDRKAEIEARFGVWADAYARSEHSAGRDLERMLSVAEPAPSDRLLDVATGSGNTAIAFAPHVAEVVATDLAGGMIEAARRRAAEAGLANVTCSLADAESLPFPDGSFDTVTCRIAPHHFLDVGRAASEVARVLRPRGRYVMVDSLGPEDPKLAVFLHEVEVRRDPTHVRSYTRAEWLVILERAGLTVDLDEVVRKPHDFEAWLERGGCDEATKREMRRRFLGAPEDSLAYLDVRIEDARVVSFTDEKILVRARL